MTDGQSEVHREVDAANQRHREFVRRLGDDKHAEMLAKGESFFLAVRPLPLHHWHWVLKHARTSLTLAEGVQVPSEARAVMQAEQLIAAGIFSDRVTLETFTHEPSEEIIVNEKELTLRRQVQKVRDELVTLGPEIARALPQHITPDRMMRIVLTTVQKTPKLLECTMRSLMGAIVEVSQLGLEPDNKRQAHLVPFWNKKVKQLEVQVIVDYRGMMDLAYRSGKVVSITATLVHECDEYKYAEGLQPVLEHIPSRERERGEIVAAYAIARLTNGSSIPCWMWRAEIDKIRDASPSKDKEGNLVGPWVTNYGEMAKKTPIRRICKYLPVSTVQRASILEEQAAAGESQQLGMTIDVASAPTSTLLLDPDPGEVPLDETEEEPTEPEPEETSQPEPKPEEVNEALLATYRDTFDKKKSKNACTELVTEAEKLYGAGAINACEMDKIRAMSKARQEAIGATRGANSKKSNPTT